MVSQCGSQEAFPCSRGSCDEQVLCLPDELHGSQPLHLVTVKPPADSYSIVNFFRISLVTERGQSYEPLDGGFQTVVPFTGKQPIKEAVRRGGFGKVDERLSVKAAAMP